MSIKSPTNKKSFRKLIAWQEAHKLTLALYKETTSFPKEERYGITDQLRRASASIGAQIAEGSQMNTKQHQRLYYMRAYGSAAEVDNFLELAHDLAYLSDNSYDVLLSSVNRTSYLLLKLMKASHRPSTPSPLS